MELGRLFSQRKRFPSMLNKKMIVMSGLVSPVEVQEQDKVFHALTVCLERLRDCSTQTCAGQADRRTPITRTKLGATF